ncbi:hypothetical protein F511_38401 [Dorcoceras hygrometricum]|uniref:Uncharacterized protein n=1 Tax=Dorcoceras hygrometricum TaxID=472368 RepID=A0A2Z7ADU8_9LAMI|nr:hypothetical protein F511_38401 [Dorcoceras hygrometricum]
MSFIAVNLPDFRDRFSIKSEYKLCQLKKVKFRFEDLWHRRPGHSGKGQDYSRTVIPSRKGRDYGNIVIPSQRVTDQLTCFMHKEHQRCSDLRIYGTEDPVTQRVTDQLTCFMHKEHQRSSRP